MGQGKTYVVILRDSVVNKIHILENLIRLTEKQGEIIKNNNPDIEEFDEVLEEKGHQIDMLNMLDDGFINVYEKVREELQRSPGTYREQLVEIQDLISNAVELGAKLEALEHSNKSGIEAFISKKKAEVRSFKSRRDTTASYSKNMANSHLAGTSYFMDSKK